MSGVREANYRHAIQRALADELARDNRVVLLGEDIARAGGVFKTTEGLWESYPDRVRDTPIAEQAIVGTAIGAALAGLVPVAEVMFADFAAVCFDQIVNTLAKYCYTSGGQANLPVTLRLANGAGGGFGPQHSQAVENWFLNVPGLGIAVPSTPEDAYGLLRSAIRCDYPVLVFEHKNLLGTKGKLPEVADDEWLVPLGQAALVRSGRHITLVATQQMRHRAVVAGVELETRGIDCEIIDPRTLVPFDMDSVVQSLVKTSRLLVLQEGPSRGGWAESLVARIATDQFDLLDAPPRLVTSPESPVPYSEPLEDAWLPSVTRIVAAAEELVRY